MSVPKRMWNHSANIAETLGTGFLVSGIVTLGGINSYMYGTNRLNELLNEYSIEEVVQAATAPRSVGPSVRNLDLVHTPEYIRLVQYGGLFTLVGFGATAVCCFRKAAESSRKNS